MTTSYQIPSTIPGRLNLTDVNYTVSPITLPPGEEIIMEVEWPTQGLASGAPGVWLVPPITPGNYTVSAYVLPALGETNLADNYFYYANVGLWTFVVSRFDLNEDIKVSYADVYTALQGYSESPGFQPP